LGEELFQPLTMVFTDYSSGKSSGRLAVIGPSRLDYAYIIPMLRYVGRLIDEVSRA
jgi:transcriptional regulator of heat shock response